jgi:hypothetical protein
MNRLFIKDPINQWDTLKKTFPQHAMEALEGEEV